MPQNGDKRKDDEQARCFVETARALGCDEDEGAFREKLRRVAQHNPNLRKSKVRDTNRPWDESDLRRRFELDINRFEEEQLGLQRKAATDKVYEALYDKALAKYVLVKILFHSDCLTGPHRLQSKLLELTKSGFKDANAYNQHRAEGFYRQEIDDVVAELNLGTC